MGVLQRVPGLMRGTTSGTRLFEAVQAEGQTQQLALALNVHTMMVPGQLSFFGQLILLLTYLFNLAWGLGVGDGDLLLQCYRLF